MARMRGKFIIGVIGNLVYRVQNGVQIVSVRTPKGTMKQTVRTKNHGKVFGKSSVFAANLRQTLMAKIGQLQQKGMRNRLSGVCTSIFSQARDETTGHYTFEQDSFSRLEGFEFNSEQMVNDHLLVKPSTVLKQKTLHVTIPALSGSKKLKFATKGIRCEMTVCLSLFMLKGGMMMPLAETQLFEVMKGNLPDVPQVATFNLPNGCFYVVTLFMEYFTANKVGWIPVDSTVPCMGRILSTGFAKCKEKTDPARRWQRIQKLD